MTGLEKITCNKCKTENTAELKSCSNCGNELNKTAIQNITFLTPQVKFQIILAIVVFLIAFLGTKYLMSEYKNSNKEQVETIDAINEN